MKSINTWYLIYTKPKQEKVAALHLTRQDYDIYLPFIQMSQRRQGRYQIITEPMFPRYLFICLNSTTDNWAPIRSTRGVTALVRFGGVPAKAPAKLIDFLMANEQRDKPQEITTPDFKQGDSVQILDGVMAGYQGIFASRSGAKRITVLLDIVGKAMKIAVPIDFVGHAQ